MLKKLTIISVMCLFALQASFALAGQQGDKVWTESNVSAFQVSSTGGVLALTFPFDPNAQPVVYYVDVTGQAGGDTVLFMGASSVTEFTKLAESFSGGVTTAIIVDSNSMVGVTGAKYAVIDDGAGTASYFEIDVISGTGDRITIISGNSGFAIGAVKANASGQRDLSGVTFPVNSRVYLMETKGAMVVGIGNVTKDNNKGLYGVQKNSPLLIMMDPTEVSASGSTIFGVTVRYEN